jgi:para-nitrobenzyl esterase
MKKSRWLIIPLLLLVFSCSEEIKPVPQEPVIEQVVMDSVLYKVTDTDSLWMNIYALNLRENLKEDVILVVHGGGFMGGSRNSPTIDPFCRLAAQSGFKVACMDYTLALKDNELRFGCEQPIDVKVDAIERAAIDILDAQKFITQNAEMRGFNNSCFLLGSSAGAEAALHSLYAPQLSEYRTSNKTLGLISLAGAILDTTWLTHSMITPSMFYHGTCDPLVPYASDIHHFCPEDSPGGMMFHGSRTIAAILSEMGRPCQLYSFCGADHSISGSPFLERAEEMINFCRDVSNEKAETKHIILPGRSDCELEPAFCDPRSL